MPDHHKFDPAQTPEARAKRKASLIITRNEDTFEESDLRRARLEILRRRARAKRKADILSGKR